MTEHRRIRLEQVLQHLPGILWAVLLFGSVLTILYACLFGAENLTLHAIQVSGLSLLIALSLAAIADLSRPYQGAAHVEPYGFLAQNRISSARLNRTPRNPAVVLPRHGKLSPVPARLCPMFLFIKQPPNQRHAMRNSPRLRKLRQRHVRIGCPIAARLRDLDKTRSQRQRRLPGKVLIVSISSRSDGTSSKSTSEKTRAISCATFRRNRSACTKSTAERNATGETYSARHPAPAFSIDRPGGSASALQTLPPPPQTESSSES